MARFKISTSSRSLRFRGAAAPAPAGPHGSARRYRGSWRPARPGRPAPTPRSRSGRYLAPPGWPAGLRASTAQRSRPGTPWQAKDGTGVWPSCRSRPRLGAGRGHPREGAPGRVGSGTTSRAAANQLARCGPASCSAPDNSRTISGRGDRTRPASRSRTVRSLTSARAASCSCDSNAQCRHARSSAPNEPRGGGEISSCSMAPPGWLPATRGDRSLAPGRLGGRGGARRLRFRPCRCPGWRPW